MQNRTEQKGLAKRAKDLRELMKCTLGINAVDASMHTVELRLGGERRNNCGEAGSFVFTMNGQGIPIEPEPDPWAKTSGPALGDALSMLSENGGDTSVFEQKGAERLAEVLAFVRERCEELAEAARTVEAALQQSHQSSTKKRKPCV